MYKISNLIDTFACLEPQITSRLSEIVEANSPPSLTRQAQVTDFTAPLNTLISELTEWREASTVLIDDLFLSSPKSVNRKNWRSRYIAKYAANFYETELKTWPRNANGNPKKRFIKAVDEICSILKLDFAGAKYACSQVLNLIDEGKHLEPPILKRIDASQAHDDSIVRSRDGPRKTDNL